MFESVQRKPKQQGMDHTEADDYWVPSWKKMLTPQQDGGVGQIQRQRDVYAGVSEHPRGNYDLEAMLGSVGPGNRAPRPRIKPNLQMPMEIVAWDKSEQDADRVAVLVTRPTKLQTANPERGKRPGRKDQLMLGCEQLSGFELSDVRVPYNSAKQAKLNAHAYTQGQDIEVGPGHENQLPHEGRHVVQQRKGWVRPTHEDKGYGVNDDRCLEKESEGMGQQVKAKRSERSGLQHQEKGILASGAEPDRPTSNGNDTPHIRKATNLKMESHPDSRRTEPFADYQTAEVAQRTKGSGKNEKRTWEDPTPNYSAIQVNESPDGPTPESRRMLAMAVKPASKTVQRKTVAGEPEEKQIAGHRGKAAEGTAAEDARVNKNIEHGAKLATQKDGYRTNAAPVQGVFWYDLGLAALYGGVSAIATAGSMFGYALGLQQIEDVSELLAEQTLMYRFDVSRAPNIFSMGNYKFASKHGGEIGSLYFEQGNTHARIRLTHESGPEVYAHADGLWYFPTTDNWPVDPSLRKNVDVVEQWRSNNDVNDDPRASEGRWIIEFWNKKNGTYGGRHPSRGRVSFPQITQRDINVIHSCITCYPGSNVALTLAISGHELSAALHQRGVVGQVLRPVTTKISELKGRWESSNQEGWEQLFEGQ